MPFNIDPLNRDPFARIDYALDRPFRGLGMGRQAGPEYRREFKPEEYGGLRDKLLGGAMSGLRGIGWALSTPGDYLRGAVSGNFGERKSGRDVLDQLGVTGKHDKGWGAWGAGLAADIATDPLMLLGLGPGAATTKAGAALGKLSATEGGIQALSRAQRLGGFQKLESGLAAAGKTADQIRHAHQQAPGRIATAAQEAQVQGQLGRSLKAGEPLASLAKIQLPFGTGPQLNLGTGATAQKVAGGMDRLGEFLRFGNPVGRGIGSLLDPLTQGATGKTGQRAMALPGAGTDVMKAAEARGQEALWPLWEEMHKTIQANQGNAAFEPEFLRAVNAIGERAPTSHLDPAIVALAQSPGQKFGEIFEKNLPVERAAGSSTKDLQDFFGLRYTHRQALHGVPGEPLERLRSMPAHMKYDVARNRNLANPGGTDRVNLWAEQGLTNPGLPLAGVQQQVFQDMMKDVGELKAAGTFPGPVDSALEKLLFRHAGDVAAELRKMGGMTGAGKHDPIFGQNPVELASSYLNRSARKQGSLEGIFRSIGETAVAAGTHPRGEAAPLTDVLKQLGLRNRVPATTAEPISGGGVKALEALASKGAPMASDLAKAFRSKKIGPGLYQPVPTSKPLNKALSRYEMSLADVAELMKQNQVGQMPEQLKGVMGLGSSFTNLFRALNYPLWLASHTRNVGTAAANMLRTDTPMGAIKSVIEQLGEIRNPNLADPALSASRSAQYAHGGVGSGFGTFSESAGMNLPQRMATGNRVTPMLPLAYSLGPQGVSPTGSAIGDAANLVLNEGLLGTGKNIYKAGQEIVQNRGGVRDAFSKYLGIKGVGGQTADTLPAVKAGWRTGENIENLFRGAQMKGLMRQGYSPAEAGRQMLKYQFDYGAHGFTPFERNMMRQVFPFYGFMRKNIPLQAETLASKPGIIGSQIAPMQQNRTQEGDFIPQYLQGNVSVPAGPAVDGKQQFFSTFGLPAEEAFGKLQFNAGDPLRGLNESLLGFASNINPLIKGPLESLTNRQFFSGRQLSDLKSPSLAQALGGALGGGENPDRDRLISQVLLNSPLSRAVTTEERLTDPRKTWWQKALNLGTGVKVTDVDVERQKAIEVRDELTRQMAGEPHLAKYTNFYVPQAKRDLLTPQEVEQLRMWSTYQENAAKYAEQRRQQTTGVR